MCDKPKRQVFKTVAMSSCDSVFFLHHMPINGDSKIFRFQCQMDDVFVFIFSIWCHFLFFAISWAFTIMPFRRVCRLTWLDAWVIASLDSLCGELGEFLLNFTCTCGSANGDMRENWKGMFLKRSPKSSTIWIFFWKLVHLCINLLNLLFWRFCVTFYHGINHQYTNLVEIYVYVWFTFFWSSWPSKIEALRHFFSICPFSFSEMLALSHLVIYLQIFEHVIVRVFPLIPNSFDT